MKKIDFGDLIKGFISAILCFIAAYYCFKFYLLIGGKPLF